MHKQIILIFITIILLININQLHANPNFTDLYSKNTLLIEATSDIKKSKNIWQKNGISFDSFLNIHAYSNNKNGKYQCTELVHRFLRSTYGVPTKIGLGLGHANTLIKNIYKRFGERTFKYKENKIKMKLYKNGEASEPPVVGSVINFGSEKLKFGHTAIARNITIKGKDSIRVYLFEQHGFPRWKVGEEKPIRYIEMKKDNKGLWVGAEKKHIGKPLNWINFQLVEKKSHFSQKAK